VREKEGRGKGREKWKGKGGFYCLLVLLILHTALVMAWLTLALVHVAAAVRDMSERGLAIKQGTHQIRN